MDRLRCLATCGVGYGIVVEYSRRVREPTAQNPSGGSVVDTDEMGDV